MKLSGVTFCNSCSLEIPEDQLDNAYRVPFLDREGHAHSEGDCLLVRNQVLAEYDQMLRSCIRRLHPQLVNTGKSALAMRILEKHGNLRRAPDTDPTKILKKLKDAPPKKPRKKRAA